MYMQKNKILTSKNCMQVYIIWLHLLFAKNIIEMCFYGYLKLNYSYIFSRVIYPSFNVHFLL